MLWVGTGDEAMYRFLPAFLALAACGDPTYGQFGEEEQVVCEEVSRTPVASDALQVVEGHDGPVTIDVAAALASLGGTFAADLEWRDGQATTIDVTLAPDASTVALVESRLVEVDTGDLQTDEGRLCLPQLRVQVAGTASTADGWLDEAFTSEAWLGDGFSGVDARVTGIGGTIDPVGLVEDDVQADALRLDIHVAPGSSVPFAGSVYPVLVANPGEDVTYLGSWPIEAVEQ